MPSEHLRVVCKDYLAVPNLITTARAFTNSSVGVIVAAFAGDGIALRFDAEMPVARFFAFKQFEGVWLS